MDYLLIYSWNGRYDRMAESSHSHQILFLLPTCHFMLFPSCNTDSIEETYNNDPPLSIYLKNPPLPPYVACSIMW
jgi:hypothetical protein